MQRELTESIIAVVGATGGLGSAIATALRSSGATVITVGRSTGSDVHLDIRDAGGGDALVEHVHITYAGRLDGVVIAAGIVAFGDVADTDDVVVEELLLTNAMGPLWLARRVAPLLAEWALSGEAPDLLRPFSLSRFPATTA